MAKLDQHETITEHSDTRQTCSLKAQAMSLTDREKGSIQMTYFQGDFRDYYSSVKVISKIKNIYCFFLAFCMQKSLNFRGRKSNIRLVSILSIILSGR